MYSIIGLLFCWNCSTIHIVLSVRGMLGATQTLFDVPGNWSGVEGMVSCLNWPVMRVPNFIALRRNDTCQTNKTLMTSPIFPPGMVELIRNCYSLTNGKHCCNFKHVILEHFLSVISIAFSFLNWLRSYALESSLCYAEPSTELYQGTSETCLGLSPQDIVGYFSVWRN